ncbi:MAG: hypothetical protein JWO67_5375 [Streptosporangiaceae bacterium]|nr:hypothetical protein [Streptosporangiaceae bacterium]
MTGRRPLIAAAAALGGVAGHAAARWLVTRDWRPAEERGWKLAREYFSGKRPFSEPVDEDDLFSETRAEQFERRLAAVEAHLLHLPPERVM